MATVSAPKLEMLVRQDPAPKPPFLSTPFRDGEDTRDCEELECGRPAGFWVSFGRGVKRPLCGLHETLAHAEWKYTR